MKRYIQHEYLKISHFEVTEWEHPVHNHNHFEIIFVHSGEGQHQLNNNTYNFGPQQLFLLGPSDFHSFTLKSATRFTFLKFNNIYLQGVGDIHLQSKWNQAMDDLVLHASQQPGQLLSCQGDASLLDQLMRLIAQEWQASKNAASETIFFLIQAVISVVRRNIAHPLPHLPEQLPDDKITQLLHYIHQHIYTADKLQIEHLAAQFGYSKNYLGVYFREQLKVTLRDYVSRYKLSLIENRLRHSTLSIKEICYEMGFTDLSHFNKFFHKHKGMGPKEFRAQSHATA